MPIVLTFTAMKCKINMEKNKTKKENSSEREFYFEKQKIRNNNDK